MRPVELEDVLGVPALDQLLLPDRKTPARFWLLVISRQQREACTAIKDMCVTQKQPLHVPGNIHANETREFLHVDGGSALEVVALSLVQQH